MIKKRDDGEVVKKFLDDPLTYEFYFRFEQSSFSAIHFFSFVKRVQTCSLIPRRETMDFNERIFCFETLDQGSQIHDSRTAFVLSDASMPPANTLKNN